ncbi:MAG: hypothetical protein PHU93_02180 [Candidatus Gracilibacteria bacterium]|nr:hypothetical protein [Candidatus Gracilibacteria bacterium]
MAPKNTVEKSNTTPFVPKGSPETTPLTPSDFQIIKDKDGFRVKHQEDVFPFPIQTPEAALDFKHRMEVLLTVQETCKKIILLQKECEFYTDKADHTIGKKYHDLFIDSGIIPLLNRTTALTHERLETIFTTNKTKNIVDELSVYLNAIAEKMARTPKPSLSK